MRVDQTLATARASCIGFAAVNRQRLEDRAVLAGWLVGSWTRARSAHLAARAALGSTREPWQHALIPAILVNLRRTRGNEQNHTRSSSVQSYHAVSTLYRRVNTASVAPLAL
jgi:hypothetical protein